MISVIIPTLNEAESLPATLCRVHANSSGHEVLVVDGGSADETVNLAKAAGARVVNSPQPQRAAQMNLGAQHAGGDAFLFLHADTWVNPGALEQIESALRNPAVAGGAFTRRFRSESAVLRLTCLLGEFRGLWLGWFLGDQGIFVRRSAFEQLGGFRDLDLFEDLDFSRRLGRIGKVVTLRPSVVSSARRFARRGPFVTSASDFWLTVRYLLGADANRLGVEGTSRIFRAKNTTSSTETE